MQKTNIDYLDYTWNPIAMRCTPVSEGCDNCWHLRLCDMHTKNPNLPQAVREAKSGGKALFIEKELDAPLRKRKPSVIGVQFMGDLFHKNINIRGKEIQQVFEVMSCCEHKFLVLTKRPKRMADSIKFFYGNNLSSVMENLWLGTTCENQKWADIRIPELLKIPAAVRFLSLEPLLGPIDLDYIKDFNFPCIAKYERIYSLKGERNILGNLVSEKKINWVVIGCESGPKRRPCKLEWVESIVEQCQAASVPVWVKQIPIGGKVSHDMNQWPKELRIREWPRKESEVSDE